LSARGATPATADLGWASAEDRVDIEHALSRLSRRQREAVVLRYYLGFSILEIADVMWVSEGTAKTTLFRARAALSHALGAREDEEEASGQEDRRRNGTEEANAHAGR